MDQRVTKVVRYIEENIDRQLSLSELAEIACLSPIHFHRLFKKELGITPGKFVEKKKITKGYALLMESKLSVQDIAITLGYNDYETFSKNFKKYYQISPDDVRVVFRNISTDVIPEGTQFLPILITKSDEAEILQEMESIVKGQYSGQNINDLKTMAVLCEKNEGEKQNRRKKNKYAISHDEELSARLHSRLGEFLKSKS